MTWACTVFHSSVESFLLLQIISGSKCSSPISWMRAATRVLRFSSSLSPISRAIIVDSQAVKMLFSNSECIWVWSTVSFWVIFECSRSSLSSLSNSWPNRMALLTISRSGYFFNSLLNSTINVLLSAWCSSPICSSSGSMSLCFISLIRSALSIFIPLRAKSTPLSLRISDVV